MQIFMNFYMMRSWKAFSTNITGKWFLTSMCSYMIQHHMFVTKTSKANWTIKVFLIARQSWFFMVHYFTNYVRMICKRFSYPIKVIWLLFECLTHITMCFQLVKLWFHHDSGTKVEFLIFIFWGRSRLASQWAQLLMDLISTNLWKRKYHLILDE